MDKYDLEILRGVPVTEKNTLLLRGLETAGCVHCGTEVMLFPNGKHRLCNVARITGYGQLTLRQYGTRGS